MNLVSDDDNFIFEGTLRPNAGITLPKKQDATHSVWLSPLFALRNGRTTNTQDNIIIYRGGNGYLYSMSPHPNNESYRIQFDQTGTVWPTSNWTNYVAYSLRCLVSTNNR